MALSDTLESTAAPSRPSVDPGNELLREASTGGEDARARLIEALTPLIARVARMYGNVPMVERGELMQEGVVGVLRALERYDPTLGTPFWAYASWWVRQAMQQLVAQSSRPLVLSDRALRQLARVRAVRREFAREYARDPTLGELARASHLSASQLQCLLVAERRPRGLQEPFANTGATFGELIRDPRAEDEFDALHTRMVAAEVPRLLGCLSRRERWVIERRYGLRCPRLTLMELGRAIGVSAERIRQIEQAALEKMRAATA
jgi:RNA polymerase sigma factor (sigma-70 family)